MNKLRAGDEVVVLSGNEKGRRGFITRVFLDSNKKPERALVEGLNMVTHFVRPNPQKNEPGGRIKKEASLHVSNLSLMDKQTGKPARVKIRGGEKGKTRVLSTGAEVS